MKEFKLEETSPLLAVDVKIWEMFDVLKSENISSDDYFVILFLLSAFKDGFLSTDLMNEKDNLSNRLIEQFHYSNNKLSNEYDAIIHNFEPLILRFSDKGLNRVFKLLAEINKQVLSENFPTFFDRVLYRISQSQGRFAGDFIQPVELTRFMCALADTKMGSKVFNPFAGLASFGAFLNEGQDYFGQELNHKNWALGALRLMAYDRSGITKYVNDDSILHWPVASEKFDLIISTPPLGLKLGPNYSEVEPNYRMVEPLLIEKGLQSLTEKGKLIVLLNPSFLFKNQEERRLRERLVEEDVIDTIISLPGGLLLNTSIPLIIMVLNRAKQRAGQVRFIDANNYVISKGYKEKTLDDYRLNSFIQSENRDENVVRIIDNEQIRANDFNLNVARYFQKQIEGVKLGEILKIVRGHRDKLPDFGKLIRIRDLKEDKVDFTLDVSIVEETELRRPDIQLVSESCLLLAMRWHTLKPTFFEFKGEPIFRGMEILSFKINEAIADIAYLVNELNADYVQEQLESYRLGASVMPFILRDDLMKIVIKLPPLKEQRRKVLDDKLLFIKQEEEKIKRIRQKHDLIAEDNNGVLRHKIGGRINNISGALEGLNDIISSQVIQQLPNLYDLRKSQKSNLTLGKYLEILKRDLSIIKEIVQKDEEVKNEINFKDFDFIKFIQDYVAELGNSISTKPVKYMINPENEIFDNIVIKESSINEIIVSGDESDFKMMLDNLEDNAVKHGFKNQFIDKNEINIECGIDQANMLLNIKFSNSGFPLLDDFTKEDFIRNGITSDKSIGDGFGGYLIYKVVKNHHGELYIENLAKAYPNSNLVTAFIVQLPIKDIVLNID
jgi:type I restriction enzyme M protein